MKHIYNQHVNSNKHALRTLFKHPISSIFILIMLGIALALPLTLYLSVQSFELILNKLSINPTITIFMENNATEAEITLLKNKLESNQELQTVEYITKEQALQETANVVGQTELVTLFDDNPLPDAFVIKPKHYEPDFIKELTTDIQKMSSVNQVNLDSQWVQTLYQIKGFINKILIFLSITLSFAFILISHNTIRLQILSSRDEIEISHLLGAAKSFIRRPFLYQAFWQGLATTILGIIISSSVMVLAFKDASAILSIYGIAIQKRMFTFTEVIIVACIVIALALIGAAWATWQYLREFEQQMG